MSKKIKSLKDEKKEAKKNVKPLHVVIYESIPDEDKPLVADYLSLMQVAASVHSRMSEEGQAKMRDFTIALQRAQKEQHVLVTKQKISATDQEESQHDSLT